MKKTFKVGLLLLIALALVAGSFATIYAKKHGGMDKKGDGQKMCFGEPNFDKMKKALDLSDDQVKKIKVIYSNNTETMKPLIKKHQDDIKAVADKLKAGAKDADLKPLLDAVDTDRQNIMNAQKKFMDDVKAVLTATQRAKMMTEKGCGMGKGCMGGMGDKHGKGPKNK